MVLLSMVFFYWNNKQLRVKQNMLWIKWITSPYVNRFIVKSMTYYPIIIRLASLRPDSGVYTSRVIAPHIFINSQSYSYVTLKNKFILFQENDILQLFPELLFSATDQFTHHVTRTCRFIPRPASWQNDAAIPVHK